MGSCCALCPTTVTVMLIMSNDRLLFAALLWVPRISRLQTVPLIFVSISINRTPLLDMSLQARF